MQSAERDTAAAGVRLEEVRRRLSRAYPDISSMLDYRSPFELVVAVALSAQTTDRQVNSVTPALFDRYPTAEALAAAAPQDVERIIHPVGFFRSKARSIIACAAMLVEQHGSEVPREMEALVKLPGIGRKSAGVIRREIFDLPAIIVDTHFGRVNRRLGFSAYTDPLKLEHDIAALLPEQHWGEYSMTANLHGRAVCTARKPACDVCMLADICPSAGVV